MPNNRFNKQVTPKGYKKGGRVGKMGGGMMMKRPMMQKGGSLKPVDPKTQKGLSKLPTKVRNKMGYMQDGGKVKQPFKITKDNIKKIKEAMKKRPQNQKPPKREPYGK